MTSQTVITSKTTLLNFMIDIDKKKSILDNVEVAQFS